MIKVSITGMVVSLKTDLRFPIPDSRDTKAGLFRCVAGNELMVEAPDHGTCQKYVDKVVNMICEKVYKA